MIDTTKTIETMRAERDALRERLSALDAAIASLEALQRIDRCVTPQKRAQDSQDNPNRDE